MYKINCEIEVTGAHKLNLDYDSRCKNLHGHNWIVKVWCKAKELNHNGMVIDYVAIKKIVNKFDHEMINDLIDFNPTAENMCKYYCDKIPFCYRVDIKETSKSWASYEKEI